MRTAVSKLCVVAVERLAAAIWAGVRVKVELKVLFWVWMRDCWACVRATRQASHVILAIVVALIAHNRE